MNAQLGIFEGTDAGASEHDDIPAAEGRLVTKTFADDAFDPIALMRKAHVLFRHDQTHAGIGTVVGASEDENFFGGDFQRRSVENLLEVCGRQQAG